MFTLAFQIGSHVTNHAYMIVPLSYMFKGFYYNVKVGKSQLMHGLVSDVEQWCPHQ